MTEIRTAGDHLTLGSAIEVPPEVAADIATILANPRAYLWDIAKGCVPDYGVRLTFVHGGQRVDVCDMLAVFHDDQRSGVGDFEPAHHLLAVDLQKVFPDDKVIQGLKKK